MQPNDDTLSMQAEGSLSLFRLNVLPPVILTGTPSSIALTTLSHIPIYFPSSFFSLAPSLPIHALPSLAVLPLLLLGETLNVELYLILQCQFFEKDEFKFLLDFHKIPKCGWKDTLHVRYKKNQTLMLYDTKQCMPWDPIGVHRCRELAKARR